MQCQFYTACACVMACFNSFTEVPSVSIWSYTREAQSERVRERGNRKRRCGSTLRASSRAECLPSRENGQCGT